MYNAMFPQICEAILTYFIFKKCTDVQLDESFSYHSTLYFCTSYLLALYFHPTRCLYQDYLQEGDSLTPNMESPGNMIQQQKTISTTLEKDIEPLFAIYIVFFSNLL
jgi:hypothetical protein